MTDTDHTPRLSLKQWIDKVYVHSSMLQLFLVNGVFLLLLLGSFFLLGMNQNNLARKEHEQELIGALQAKTDWVNARLASVENNLQVLRRQTQRAFAQPGPGDVTTPLALTEHKVLMKPEDDGGVALYYSNRAQDLSVREAKARKLLPLSPLFADLQETNPLVKQAYLNTPDGMNFLHPYQDVDAQFAPDLDLTAFSFYYLADERHNPQRQPVWTDAYLDPAGLGWIISHIAPVYNNERLAAVVGLDLTVETLINKLFRLAQPWSGYAVLVGKDGNILALPPEGEADFGLEELTQSQYSFRHVTTNEFRSELFNLYKRPEMATLSRMIAQQQAGLAQVELNEPSIVAWNTVPLTGWKLLAVTTNSELYTDVTSFTDYLKDVTLLVLLCVFVIFSVHLGVQRSRTRKLYLQMQAPLYYFKATIEAALDDSKAPVLKRLNSPVVEIEQTRDLIHSLAERNTALKASAEQHESACQRQSVYLRSLLNNIPVPVFDTDGSYRIQGCNRAFEAFFGKSERELKGRLLSELIPITPPKEGALAKELILTNVEEQSRHISVVVSCSAEPLRNRDKNKQRPLIGLMIDLSEQYQARDQMKFDRDRALEASQLQTEYLQAMRRELERPLLELANLTEQLRDQPDEHRRLGLLLKEKTEALLFVARDSWLETDSEASAGSAGQPHPPSPKTAHVLVVDDGPVNTMLAKSVLQKVGYKVDVVYSGQDALARMTERTYQVVLMDIFMPEMDGIETTRRWREREQGMQVPPAAIIALTANVLESERQRFFDAGMNAFLAKPYQPSQLRSEVDYWRQQYEAGQVSV